MFCLLFFLCLFFRGVRRNLPLFIPSLYTHTQLGASC